MLRDGWHLKLDVIRQYLERGKVPNILCKIDNNNVVCIETDIVEQLIEKYKDYIFWYWRFRNIGFPPFSGGYNDWPCIATELIEILNGVKWSVKKDG